jgi:hypothetical protein
MVCVLVSRRYCKSLVNMVLEKNKLKRHKFENTTFHASLLGNGLNKKI